MKRYLLLPALFITTVIYAQIPEDVIRYSFFPQNGTARTLAIGGAMGSLGGDVTATFVNPAGLGNYKTGEFVFTPGFFMNNNKTNFRGTDTKNNMTNGGIGSAGGANVHTQVLVALRRIVGTRADLVVATIINMSTNRMTSL